MALISQKDVSSVSVSEVTGQLARIQSQADGDAAVALLNDNDRLLLNSAITSYSKEKGISISEIAKELGIGRTYLYNLLDSNQIELNRLRIIQNYLGINILGEETIDLFLKDLRKKLNGKSYNSSWVSKCNLIKVDQYYLLEFLLPAMKKQVTFWEHMVSISNENDKSIFGNTASHENYKFTKMIEYIENLEDLKINYFEQSAKFDEDLEGDPVAIPIDPMCSYWADIEDELEEDIWNHCDELIKDHKKEIERTSKKKEKKDRQKIIAFYEKDYREALEKCHEEFCNELGEEFEKINAAKEQILEYMSVNNRLVRKQSHWPLELLEIAKNLEENTIPKKEKKAK